MLPFYVDKDILNANDKPGHGKIIISLGTVTTPVVPVITGYLSDLTGIQHHSRFFIRSISIPRISIIPEKRRWVVGMGSLTPVFRFPYFFSSVFAASSFFSFLSSLRPFTALTAATLPTNPIKYQLLIQPSHRDRMSFQVGLYDTYDFWNIYLYHILFNPKS